MNLMRLIRVGFAGGVSTSVDTVVLFLLCAGAGLAPGFAAVAGCLAGGGVNFALNRRWVFAAHHHDWRRQALRYAVIVVGGGAVVSGVAVAALDAVGLPLLVAKGCAVVIALVTWNYPMSARVVFAPRPSPQPGRAVDAGERGGEPDPVVVVR